MTDVALCIGVHPSYLRRVLAEHEPMTHALAARLSDFFGVPVVPTHKETAA